MNAAAWHEVGHTITSAVAREYFSSEGLITISISKLGGGRFHLKTGNDYVEGIDERGYIHYLFRWLALTQAGYVFEQLYISSVESRLLRLWLTSHQVLCSMQDRLVCFLILLIIAVRLKRLDIFSISLNSAILNLNSLNYPLSICLVEELLVLRTTTIPVRSDRYISIETEVIEAHISQVVANLCNP